MTEKLISWQLDKLTEDQKALIALIFSKLVIGWTLCYMVEVRLDQPEHWLIRGGEGIHSHGGNGSKCYARYINNPDWAVVHCEDADWLAQDIDVLRARGDEVLDQYVQKFMADVP